VENFAWHEFADHYLEMAKYRTRDAHDEGVQFTLYTISLGIVKMLAPLMPHVTEDIYQESFLQPDGARSVHVSQWPTEVLISQEDEEKGELVKDIISAIRTWKSEKGLPLNKEMELVELIGDRASTLIGYERDILETSRASELKIVAEADLEEKVMELKPVKAKLGPTFKQMAKDIIDEVRKMEPEEAASALENDALEVRLPDGSMVTLTSEFFEVEKKLTLEGKAVDTLQVKDVLVAIEQ